MAGVMDSVNQRTQLVGQNRLELLLFRLDGNQLYGINVFKVREVVKLPHLNKMPGAHHNISGVANIRGTSIPVIDSAPFRGPRCSAKTADISNSPRWGWCVLRCKNNMRRRVVFDNQVFSMFIISGTNS